MCMVNVSQALIRPMRAQWPAFSVNDLKAWFRGRKYVVETLKLLPEMPDSLFIDQVVSQMAELGRINHAVNPSNGEGIEYRGALHPLAQQQMSIIGPYAARVNHTCDNATRVPGLLHAPKVSRRKVSPSHHAVRWHPVRHTYDQPASCTVCCRRVPSNAPSPSNTPCVPAGISSLTRSTSAIWRSSGKCPFGPWRTRQASGRALP